MLDHISPGPKHRLNCPMVAATFEKIKSNIVMFDHASDPVQVVSTGVTTMGMFA